MFFRRLLTFSLLFPTVLLFSCQKENALDCVKSTGPIKTETRNLPPFRVLRVFDNIDVKLVADTAFFAEIKAGENLLENITTEVKYGELWLQNINKCNWVRSYKKPLQITVHTPRIGDIFHDGHGTISSTGPVPSDTLFLHLTSAGNFDLQLNAHYVWLDMYETGDLKLRGTTHFLQAFNYSMGRLQATELQTREAYVQVSHLGHAYVNATQVLNATILNKGNVYYSGQPPIISRQGEGAGQLVEQP